MCLIQVSEMYLFLFFQRGPGSFRQLFSLFNNYLLSLWLKQKKKTLRGQILFPQNCILTGFNNLTVHRHCDLLSGPSTLGPWQSDRATPPPATASLLHPPRASRPHTLYRLAGVKLSSALQGAGWRHLLRLQSVVQSRVGDGPHTRIFGLWAWTRRHLSGLLTTLFWRLNAQQGQQQTECGVTRSYLIHVCDRDMCKQRWAMTDIPPAPLLFSGH